jgi:hypothetical protein
MAEENEVVVEELDNEPDPVEPEEDETPPERPEDELEEPEAKPQSRAERRIQALANEKAVFEERARVAEEARIRAEEQARMLQQAQHNQEFNQLDPEEQWRRNTEAQIRNALFMSADNNDRSEFLLKVSNNPTLAKYIPEVEKVVQDSRKSGGNPTREQALTYLLGQKQMEALGKAKKTVKQASERVQEARGSSPQVKSDVKPSSGKSLMDKYGDMQI